MRFQYFVIRSREYLEHAKQQSSKKDITDAIPGVKEIAGNVKIEGILKRLDAAIKETDQWKDRLERAKSENQSKSVIAQYQKMHDAAEKNALSITREYKAALIERKNTIAKDSITKRRSY